MTPTPALRLEELVGFLNTLDVEEGTDELADAATASRWLAEHVPSEGEAQVAESDLPLLRELRDVLRGLAVAHLHGEPPDPVADRYEALADRFPLRTTLQPDGELGLTARGEGAAHIASRFLAAVTAASMAGGWHRVKICPAEGCRWAFIDRSKNRSRRWCAMGACGNREKVRTYRTRHRDVQDR